jgi:hypothetical protein
MGSPASVEETLRSISLAELVVAQPSVAPLAMEETVAGVAVAVVAVVVPLVATVVVVEMASSSYLRSDRSNDD